MSPFLALFALQTGDPYVRLGMALPKEEWAAAQAFVADPAAHPPAFIPVGSTPLAAQKATAARYASIIGGLRVLSDRPYRPDENPFGNEDYTAVKDVARLALFAAHVRFADGDRHGAVTVLLDGLTMARRIRGSTTNGVYVSAACESMMLASVDSHLDQISLPECDRIRAMADAILAEKPLLPIDAGETVRAAFATPGEWGQKGADPFVRVLAKEGTQMRLLRLHMRIEAYRWRYEKLPAELANAAPANETEDPLTRLPFRYEQAGSGYRLYGEGLPGLGPVGLRYRKDPKLTDPDEPPDQIPPEKAG